jgi:cysteine dioxygenase
MADAFAPASSSRVGQVRRRSFKQRRGRTDNSNMISLEQTLRSKRRAATGLGAAWNGLVRSLADVDFLTVDVGALESCVAAARIDAQSLAPFVHFVPDRYTRNGVYRDERYELLVMCWPRGVRSPVHDHGGSQGFVKVLRGRLTAENFVIPAGAAGEGVRLEPGGTRTMNRGEIDIVSPGQDVHRVGACGGRAITLHVYAKPLDRYRVFDVASAGCRQAVSRYDIAPAGFAD